LKQQGLCPYEFFPSDIKRVVDLQALLCDLEKQAFAKVDEAKNEKKQLEEKLRGLRFNMED